MTGSAIDVELVKDLDAVFSVEVDRDMVAASEGLTLQDSLWQLVSGLDLPGIGVAEERGGAGGEIGQVAALMVSVGRNALPVPLLEHHLAGWLLARSGADVPDDPAVAVVGHSADRLVLRGDRLSGEVPGVPWGFSARLLVALVHTEEDGDRLVAVDRDDLRVDVGSDLAGQETGRVLADGARCRVLEPRVTRAELEGRAVLLRAARMSGAMDRVAALTLDYVRARRQFGVPIGSFQSVQQHVVTVHQLATMTSLCVSRAVAPAAAGVGSYEPLAAALLAGQNAALLARAAHQAHGAIGMTREFVLQQYTRRLLQWRCELGRPGDLAARLGGMVAGVGSVRDVITAEPGTTLV